MARARRGDRVTVEGFGVQVFLVMGVTKPWVREANGEQRRVVALHVQALNGYGDTYRVRATDATVVSTQPVGVPAFLAGRVLNQVVR
jgi:hypothetical protein